MSSSMRNRLIVVASITVVAIASTNIIQAHGGDPNQVHGCANPAGKLRVVGPDEQCHDTENATDWSVVGPPGPPGAGGQDGMDGQDGLNGQNDRNGANGQDGMDDLDGTSGYLRIRQTAEWEGDPPNLRALVIDCPNGARRANPGQLLNKIRARLKRDSMSIY